MQIHTSYESPKTCKAPPSFCGVATAREAYCSAKPSSRSQEAPYFHVWCEFQSLSLVVLFFPTDGSGGEEEQVPCDLWFLNPWQGF